MTGDGGIPTAPLAPLAPLAHGHHGHAWRRTTHPARWCRLPTPLCPLVAVLSLTLGACGGSPPPGLCDSPGDAPPGSSIPLRVLPPLAADGVVYVGYTVLKDHYLPQTVIAALRASDGALLWSVPDANYTYANDTYPNRTRGMAYADGVLLLLGSGIVALRAQDGTTLWQALPWGVNSDGAFHFAVSRGVLYIVRGDISAVRISDGRLLWQTVASEGQAWSQPLVDGITVYVGADDLLALRADTGALLWKAFPSTPALAKGSEYVPLGVVAGQLYVVATGTGPNGVLRVKPADGASTDYPLPLPPTSTLLDPLLIMNGTLYVGVAVSLSAADRRDIAAFRLRVSGATPLWRLSAGGGVMGILAHDAQTLYLTLAEREAVQLTDGAVLWRQGEAFTQAGYVGGGGSNIEWAADAGQLFVAISGVGDPCEGRVYPAPTLTAFKRADGSVAWTRALTARG
ncbi:MAG TPA: PQQ-binding-like beta-propeller repeat protein [Ktedonobacterales bacterium]|nr:PQQ-binding-like beta-propeller repeat protein [Ktedonobacterales bacterium]